jgi:hypothetical protein
MKTQPSPLDRRLLLIQIKSERDDGCQAVVPIHPSIYNLPNSIRNDEGTARNALLIARGQFEKESGDYIEYLKANGFPLSPLGLEKFMGFDDSWLFEFFPYGDLLAMRWDFGGEDKYEMGAVRPIAITNAISTLHSGKRQARIEECECVPNVAIFYGSVREDDHLLLPRESMLEYEEKVVDFGGLAHRENGWITEVPASAFCSSYTLNVPQALLLRNWAVEYHNSLLKHTPRFSPGGESQN